MAPSTAAQLKEEGNTLFVQKDFARAHDKYTEAIAIDGQNAVLYANRSACSFGMDKFLDALRDAHQATEIDPGYAKGWSRRATAHDAVMEFGNAVEAWQKALDALPKANLSPAELKQKEQYTASLHKAKRRLDAESSKLSSLVVSRASIEKPPWVMAEEMLPELQAAGLAKVASSAYLIHFANQEFKAGVNYILTLKKIPLKGTPAGFATFGHTHGLACITNAIMRDQRVFRIDGTGWFDKYNDQVTFECEKYSAWNLENVEEIKQGALKRLKKGGWSDVRPALATTVRGWIMRAFFDSEFEQAKHVAVERYQEILELLHWGRQVWRGVSKDDRGVIFEDTFVTGIKVLYLETLLGAHAKAADVADKKAFLDTIFEVSRELLSDVTEKNDGATEPVDPGFISSFHVYPIAQAHTMLGYYFVQMARSNDNPMPYYSLAVKEYTLAAKTLPLDDEKFCWYMYYSIEPMLRLGAPKHVIMGVVKAIRTALPEMQRIWAHSASAKQGRDAMIEVALRDAERVAGGK